MNDILENERGRINQDLEEILEFWEGRVDAGIPLSEDVDLAADEVIEFANLKPEIGMHQEAQRFLVPTVYDDADDDEGPKRLRPAFTRLVGAELFSDPDLMEKARAAVPTLSPWASILENPVDGDYDSPEEQYRESLDYLSLSLELLHNFTLIHDDIMDDDETRRTVDTSWKRLAEKAEELGWAGEEAEEMGKNQAILVGDYVRNLAEEVIDQTGFAPEKKEKVRKSLREAERRILFGQTRDLYMEGQLGLDTLFNDERSRLDEFLMGEYGSLEDLYRDMIDKKTVDLFVAAADIGAIAADADEQQRDHLRRYARNVGIPFQIRDDLIEIETASRLSDVKSNKDITDIKNGKTTLPLMTAYKNIIEKIDEIDSEIDSRLGDTETPEDYYLDEIDELDDELFVKKRELEEEKELIEQRYGEDDLNGEEVKDLADVIYRHESSSDFYNERVEKGIEHLYKADIPGDEAPFLAFADYLKDRDR